MGGSAQGGSSSGWTRCSPFGRSLGSRSEWMAQLAEYAAAGWATPKGTAEQQCGYVRAAWMGACAAAEGCKLASLGPAIFGSVSEEDWLLWT